MENQRQTYVGTAPAKDNTKNLLAASFSWMTLGLLITTVFALLFHYVPQLLALLTDKVVRFDGKVIYHRTILGYIVMFAPLGLVLLMSFRVHKMSFPVLMMCFVIFSASVGASLYYIFIRYEVGSIINCFFSATALFGLFAAAGYFTKTDLTKLGSILFIGLGGIIIASVINWFTRSPTMDYIISFIGVAIFTGLTAYDVQKIKNLGSRIEGGEALAKMSIMGALELYLDFLNIFLFLLRLFGNRN
ncbi:MAG: Bax inhibitor-1/YccA family protein [Bacteroidia bacterium]|nr:Bax inhibitor-1/YccA family protein [Bacteroidia bacterium]